ncbi:Ig-like domain-containing protein, partial [Leeuwenhoekiella parthenopeia]
MKLKITLSLVGLFIFSGIFTSHAQLKNSFDVRYEGTLRGNFTTIANNMMSRTATGNYTGEDGNHDFTDNVYVDIDSDASTFNSSSANLVSFGSNNCITIKKAFLYWTAGDKEPGSLSSDNQPGWNYNQVKLKLPGQSSYTTYTADQVLYRGRDEHFQNDPYACVKDITAQVQALGANYAGTYTVGNVEAKTGTIIGHQGANGGDIIGASAGWQLVIVYEDVNRPTRNITLFDGFANVTRNSGENNYDILFDGFRTVPNGAVNADVVFGALEGDRDLIGDRLQIRNTANTFTDLSTGLRQADNFFNSRVSQFGQNYTNRTPASTNTLGFDAGVFKLSNPNNALLGNNQTSAVFRLTSNQETYSLYMLGFAVEAYEPELEPMLLTTALGNNPVVFLNQNIDVSFNVKNYGNDDMRDLRVRYELPRSVEYLNPINLPSGVTASYDAATRILTFAVADNLVEDTDSSFQIGFRLRVSDDCLYAGSSFTIQTSSTYRGVINPNEKTSGSSTALVNGCPIGNNEPVRVYIDPSSCTEFCSGIDTDSDGLPDNCDDDDDNDGILDANEGNSSNALLVNPTDATVSNLNNTRTGIFPLDPQGPATLPNGGVKVSVLSYGSGTVTNNRWRIYQPPLTQGIININGGDVPFATKYLDVINGIPRTVEFDYGVSASALSTATSKYTYIVGIAGLGGAPGASPENGIDVFNVPLRVIGNVDVFNTGFYSTFAGETPPVENDLGNTISSSRPNQFQGYTFFYINDRDVSKFQIEFKNEDPHGIIFGVLEEKFRDTDGDGLVDSRDVDSDNDGCYDAIEGAGNFNKLDLTADFNLANTPGGVNANGVPTIAGSPQGNTQAVIDNTISECFVPTAVDDFRQVNVNTSLNIDVLSNDDFGADGANTTAPLVIVQQPVNGSVVINNNGTPSNLSDDTIVYTPNTGYEGTDTFRYKIVDFDGDESFATVNITVSDVIVVPPGERGCDCAPLYGDSRFTNPVLVSGSNNQVGAVYRFSNVFADSPNPIDALVKITAFNNGATLLDIDVSTEGVANNFQPRINSTNNGDQSVAFEITFVSGGGTYGDEVEISFFGTPFDIDGDSQATREYAELSLPDAYYQSQNTLINIERKTASVRGTAINPTTAPGGDISVDSRYTFSNYWEGKSKLNYVIGKENGNIDRYYSLALRNANYTDPQSTIITAPVICGNVSDEGGDPLSGVTVSLSGSDGSSASTTTDINGNYRFATAIPSALVNVTYTITEVDPTGYVSVNDVEGEPTDNKITRIINLISSCENNFVDDGRPVAQDDAAIASPLRPVQPVNIDVLANDTFGPDGPSEGTITIVTQPAFGSVAVNPGDLANDPSDDFIVYTPPTLNLQATSFVYKICDSDGDCDEATVLINISNDVPEAEDDTFTVSEDSENNVLNVLANDFFGNDGAGSLSIVNTTPNGDLSVNDNGTPGDASDDFLVYAPNENFFGTDTFTYQICDANNDCVTATGTITVEADPVLSVENVEVMEGQPLTFVFTLAEVSVEDVVISVSTSNGTATAGLDYDAVVNETITIQAGELTANYTVNSLEDTIYELSENFTITGTVQTNNTRNLVAEATGTITDNDGNAPAISIADVTVSEGDDAEFVVTLDKPSFEDIVVDITFADGSATNPEDYTDGTPLQVTIPAGSTTSEPIVFPTVDDNIFEPSENFTVTGTVSTGTVSNSPVTASGTITDNDGNAPAISIADVTVSEGDDAEFVVTLDKPSFEDIVVDITFADGSATNPEDYTDGTPLQVTIPAGSTTSEPIVFPTVDDNIFEPSENFTVTGTVSTGTVSNSPVTASGTITDNDGNAPAISIADVTVSEGDDAEFVVTLDKPSFEDIVVDITFADGSATNPEDYTDGTPLQVTIPAGSTTSEPIVFPTVDDNIFESSENFTVTGTVSTGTVSNSPVTASGTITDNDGNAPAISIADVT